MLTTSTFISAFLALATLPACGSPLLDHDQAGDYVAASRDTTPTPSACPLDFSHLGYCASVTWTTGPSSDESAFTLKFWVKNGGGESGPFVDPAPSVGVKLWMPDMGHGSSPVTITRTEAGVYQVSRVFFIMPGDWEVRVQIKRGTDIQEEVAAPVLIP